MTPPVETLIDSSPASETELTLAFQDGDESAFETIHERYVARVFGVCRRLLGNPEDAEEAAQETFLRVYQGLGRFNGRYQLGAWITRIATNVCLDRLRARNRRPTSDWRDTADLEGLGLADVSDPEVIALRRDEGARVRATLASIPPLHRAAIVLRDFRGLTYDEVGAELGLSEGQVKSLIHRARKSFRKTWLGSIASALLPLRLLHRLRRLASPVRDQGSNAIPQATEAVASGAQLGASCTAVLQQCGQFMADKLVPWLTAAAMGAATLVGPAASSDERPRPIDKDVTAEDRLMVSTGDRLPATTDDHRRVGKTAPVAAAVPTDDPTTSESEDPGESGAEETPPQEVPQDPASEPRNDQGEKPPPAAEPSGFDFIFDINGEGRAACTCVSETAVESENVEGDTESFRFSQSMTGSASMNGTEAYGLELSQSGDEDGHSLRWYLRTDESTYLYEGSAGAVSLTETAWGGVEVTYAGDYRLVSWSGERDVAPGSGTYTARVTLAPASQRLVGEALLLQPSSD